MDSRIEDLELALHVINDYYNNEKLSEYTKGKLSSLDRQAIERLCRIITIHPPDGNPDLEAHLMDQMDKVFDVNQIILIEDDLIRARKYV